MCPTTCALPSTQVRHALALAVVAQASSCVLGCSAYSGAHQISHATQQVLLCQPVACCSCAVCAACQGVCAWLHPCPLPLLGVRAGHWFTVRVQDGITSLQHRPDLLQRAEPVICAFDIETTKLPLRFPNSAYDQVRASVCVGPCVPPSCPPCLQAGSTKSCQALPMQASTSAVSSPPAFQLQHLKCVWCDVLLLLRQVFMISYMVDRKGFLIVNREVVGADISDFEYTPKPEYEGPFTVINTPDEVSLLRAWFQHMRQVRQGCSSGAAAHCLKRD